eukprot:scaffold19_cov114-Cylindrotheca_fusiformis.AAC.13
MNRPPWLDDTSSQIRLISDNIPTNRHSPTEFPPDRYFLQEGLPSDYATDIASLQVVAYFNREGDVVQTVSSNI